MVAGQPPVHGGVDDPIEAHGEGVDVLHLPALTLRDQCAELQVLVLDHLDGVLQRAHLHLGRREMERNDETLRGRFFCGSVGSFLKFENWKMKLESGRMEFEEIGIALRCNGSKTV